MSYCRLFFYLLKFSSIQSFALLLSGTMRIFQTFARFTSFKCLKLFDEIPLLSILFSPPHLLNINFHEYQKSFYLRLPVSFLLRRFKKKKTFWNFFFLRCHMGNYLPGYPLVRISDIDQWKRPQTRLHQLGNISIINYFFLTNSNLLYFEMSINLFCT